MTIVFDISTVARSLGIPGGIGRVERELAKYAFGNRPEIVFSFYDHSIANFRVVKREWVLALIRPETVLDTSRLPLPSRPRKALRYRLPQPLAGIAFWTRRFRHNLVVALERIRLTTASPLAERVAARLLRHARKVRRGYSIPPQTVLPFDVVIGDVLAVDGDSVLISVGNDWAFKDPGRIAALKERYGFRYVVLCHDLIPVRFPQLIGDTLAEVVHRYWVLTFPVADLVIFTTKTVEDDVRNFCKDNNLELGRTARVSLGWDPSSFFSAAAPDLPAGIEPGKYVLLVGWLDARKGHELMMSVWKRLLAEDIPQSHGMKLVFVGEHLSNTAHLREHLSANELGDTLVHVRGVPDSLLATFYRNACFCVLPSQYEGFGLPIVEAFGAGKAVIASNGGAIPEVVAGLGPCLDPADEEAWYQEMRRWICEPEVLTRYEQKIRREFSMPSWHEASERFFNAVLELTGSDRSPPNT